MRERVRGLHSVVCISNDGWFSVCSCEIIRDWKTGDSLNYAFIEFAERAACEEAYLKMDNVSIDDRRIKVCDCHQAHDVVMVNAYSVTPCR